MQKVRSQITTALQNTPDIKSIMYSNSDIPKSLPAAIVTLESETGMAKTARRYLSSDFSFTVHLIVNAHNVADPDADLYTLKEAFRTAWQDAAARDFSFVEYYTSRIDGARLVRIARISIQKLPGAHA
ncbi:MAG: hypothetical protein PHC50_03375 [Candidatus Cloacimonetes bacterium]|nr:hypothetical protein [Candidatus Cloacimonadota bacterium]